MFSDDVVTREYRSGASGRFWTITRPSRFRPCVSDYRSLNLFTWQTLRHMPNLFQMSRYFGLWLALSAIEFFDHAGAPDK
jgi:hypothetical protein